jgi:hypothetical protein
LHNGAGVAQLAEHRICNANVEGSIPFPSSIYSYMHKKTKGAIAELAVAAKLLKEGWSVLFPFGENHRYDLVGEKDGKFLRVQVKYISPSNGSLTISCKSSNNWSVDKYTSKEVDFIAAYDSASGNIYFIPSSKLNSSAIVLRLNAAKNKQKAGINEAREFMLFK